MEKTQTLLQDLNACMGQKGRERVIVKWLSNFPVTDPPRHGPNALLDQVQSLNVDDFEEFMRGLMNWDHPVMRRWSKLSEEVRRHIA